MAKALGTLKAEGFLALPLRRAELLDGEVVERMPPGGLDGEVAAELTFRLKAWARAPGLSEEEPIHRALGQALRRNGFRP